MHLPGTGPHLYSLILQVAAANWESALPATGTHGFMGLWQGSLLLPAVSTSSWTATRTAGWESPLLAATASTWLPGGWGRKQLRPGLLSSGLARCWWKVYAHLGAGGEGAGSMLPQEGPGPSQIPCCLPAILGTTVPAPPLSSLLLPQLNNNQ